MKAKRLIALALAAVFMLSAAATPVFAAAALPQENAALEQQNDMVSIRLKATGDLVYGSNYKLEVQTNPADTQYIGVVVGVGGEANGYEQWLRYIVEEAVPKIQYLAKERNGWDDLPGVIAFGCSLGATHAVNLYLRRPDVFCGCLALSGIYTAHYGFGDYMDELVYQNSPVDYMRNFPTDHPYMELYRNQKAVICCGQGAWEQPDTTWYLKRIFEAKGIPVWVDLWGHDVKHDWDWWYKQVVYYMPYILGQQ